jgi:tetratricopeptide (TPR) repeat protein
MRPLENFVADFRRAAIVQHLDLVYLADAYTRAGQPQEAVEVAQRALARAQADERHGQRVHALRTLADAHTVLRQNAEAAASYDEALSLAHERSMRPLVAHCHLGLGKLYRRTGARQQAQEHLTSATTMYREMEMRFWLEQAEGETSPLA